MRLGKAIAVSLAIHLLAAGCVAIGSGIKRYTRKPAPDAVFAELLPPSPAPAPDTAHRLPDQLAETPMPAQAQETPPDPPATREPSPPPAPTAAQPPPRPASVSTAAVSTAALATSPVSPADNAAVASPGEMPDRQSSDITRMHRMAAISTAAFYRDVPAELSQVINSVLEGGTLLSQGDALIHMDVTPAGQVGQAHIQANSPALLNRLEQVEWTRTLPPRPMAACNAIHLRISVVGNDIQVNVEFL
ncbi:MAG TPA: hypothetical protein VGK27_02620 [Candidatus Deferrimicrobiaceae bacterium]